MEKGVDYPGIGLVYFCHDGNGNFLMSHRKDTCRDERGKWDIGGGAIEFGEKVIETLKKEIKEEYSTDIIEYEFLGYRDIHRIDDNKKTHWVGLDFKVLIDSKKVKNGEPHKFYEIGWFNKNNMPSKELLHSQLTYFLEKYKDKLF